MGPSPVLGNPFFCVFLTVFLDPRYLFQINNKLNNATIQGKQFQVDRQINSIIHVVIIDDGNCYQSRTSGNILL